MVLCIVDDAYIFIYQDGHGHGQGDEQDLEQFELPPGNQNQIPLVDNDVRGTRSCIRLVFDLHPYFPLFSV